MQTTRLLYFALCLCLCLWGATACDEPSDSEFKSDLYRAAPPTEMIYVEAGAFTMGSDYDPDPDFLSGEIDEPFSDEHPERTVELSAYWIERSEVTNAQYRACVWAKVCTDPQTNRAAGIDEYYTSHAYDDYPVVNVTWRMAADYCQWRGRRLPTEAEWEKAARGAADERIYSWGWQEPVCGLADISVPRLKSSDSTEWYETCYGRPVAVGYYGNAASPYGATEMTGNVAEWTADYYAADYYDPELWPDNDVDPSGPSAGDRRVTRGGSFAATAMYARVTYRDPIPESFYDPTVGFRCAGESQP
ncbi:MAG: formylglycine-generating enzyme family protein [Myxococcales bacterium]|nr:formylglycine-generating enzyme family protein [Myxococcales bacterium]